MASKNFKKINDVSQSKFVLAHLAREYKPASNLAVGMARVSIKKNKDSGNSDLEQIEKITEYGKAMGLRYLQRWDVAETGHKHAERTQFLDMLECVRRNGVKHIVFSHQSRSNRNRESAKELETLIRNEGVTVHCVRDGLVLHAGSPLEDWLRWDIFNGLNEKFSKDHKANVVAGMSKKIEMGVFPGLAPFGYKNVRVGGPDGEAAFEIVPAEGDYVRSAFELFATGCYSEPALKARLEEIYPHMRGRRVVQRISDMLHNPFYHGHFRMKGETYEGNLDYHPRLISYDLFRRVQAVLARPERSKRKVTQRNHPYLGLLKCGGRILDIQGQETDEPCGCSITAEEKRKKLADGSIRHYVYYHCASMRRCSHQDRAYTAKHGLKLNYDEAALELMFEPILRPLAFKPDVVKWMQGHLMTEHLQRAKDHRQATSAVLARRTMLLKMIDGAYEDKVSGDLSQDLWREKNAKWTAELGDVLEQIKALDDQKDDALQAGVELIELVQHFEKIYKSATPEVKRRIIEVVSSNHVLRNGTICSEYKKPFDLLAEGSSKDKWWTRTESNR